LKIPATSKRQVPVFANIGPSTSSTAFDDLELDMELYMSVGLVDDVGREEDEDNEPFIDGDDDDNDVEDSDD
jgi:hypothetical protein